MENGEIKKKTNESLVYGYGELIFVKRQTNNMFSSGDLLFKLMRPIKRAGVGDNFFVAKSSGTAI